jgi:hypothetical protein
MTPEAQNVFGVWPLLVSTLLFISGLGTLVLVAIRAKKRENKLYKELDDQIPDLAQQVNRMYVRKHGKRNTQLDIIINESFSASQKQAKLP